MKELLKLIRKQSNRHKKKLLKFRATFYALHSACIHSKKFDLIMFFLVKNYSSNNLYNQH